MIKTETNKKNSSVNSKQCFSGTSSENNEQNSSKLTKSDSVHSGESKFKVFSFEPTEPNNSADVEKCVAFWKFIENQNDLKPHRGFSFTEPEGFTESKTDEKEAENENEENVIWSEILELLQAKGIDKIANLAKTSVPENKRCQIDLSEITDPKFDFQLSDLNDFDPQRKYFKDAATITDVIATTEVEIQTIDFEEEQKAEDRKLLQHFQDDVRQLCTDVKTHWGDPCICDACVCLSKLREGPDEGPKQNKSICTCGEPNCNCTQCSKIIAAVDSARDSYSKLSAKQIENCPCANIGCSCLENLQALLATKKSMQDIFGSLEEESATTSRSQFQAAPVASRCSCSQVTCPCGIVVDLMNEIDHILGCAQKAVEGRYSLGTQGDIGECKCPKEEGQLPCMCLQEFRTLAEASTSKITDDPKGCLNSSLETSECWDKGSAAIDNSAGFTLPNAANASPSSKRKGNQRSVDAGAAKDKESKAKQQKAIVGVGSRSYIGKDWRETENSVQTAVGGKVKRASVPQSKKPTEKSTESIRNKDPKAKKRQV